MTREEIIKALRNFNGDFSVLGKAADMLEADGVPVAWQSIDTAPKDGTTIDLWHKEFGRFAECYWGLPHHCCGEAGSYCDSDVHSMEPGWVDTFNDISFPASEYTHWAPLPPAPGTQPAIQERKPLTDEQIRNASLQAGMQEHYIGFHSVFIRFARAIEAAHGIAENKP